MTMYVMNTTIIPPPFVGLVRVSNLSIAEASAALRNNKYTSAVGHAATAAILTSIIGVKIKMNRVQIRIKSGDRILAFQLAKRLEEGRIIGTVAELEEIGYSLRLLEFENV